jgi:hypothetical protein
MTDQSAPKRPDSCHELAVKMLDELRSCICEIYADEGFSGPIYHYSFKEKAVQVAEKFLRTAEENQDDERTNRGRDNRSASVGNSDSGTRARIDAVAPPLTEAPQPLKSARELCDDLAEELKSLPETVSTGFLVAIRFHSRAAYEQTDTPEKVRFAIGKAIDNMGIDEEIDYTLEVRRCYGTIKI